MQAVKDRINPEITEQEVLYEIGYEDAPNPPQRVVRLVEDYLQSYGNLMEPVFYHTITGVQLVQGNYSFLEAGRTIKSRVVARLLENCEQACLFAVSLGPNVDAEILKLAESGHMLQSRVLDAIGSIAVDKLADYVQDSMRETVSREGMTVSRRFSPGHCDWSVSDQRKMFKMLGVPKNSIRLNRQYLMLPQKSLCGLFGIGSGDTVELYDPCITCAQKECHGRRYSLNPC